MHDDEGSASPSQDNERRNASHDYLVQARRACERGDDMLGMHLYLAAYENVSRGLGADAARDVAVECLKSAWGLACKLKERAQAEYIFERLGDMLPAAEMDDYAYQLQELALDKLEEFGVSREDLQGVTDLIAHEVGDMAAAEDEGDAEDEDPHASSGQSRKRTPVLKGIASFSLGSSLKAGGQDQSRVIERVLYKDLVGYGRAVSTMRQYGVGMQDDPEFRHFVDMLNVRHGVDRMPASDSIVFSSPAREDAAYFMEATFGELGLPGVRMRMEESLSGMSVLSVMTQAGNQPRLNAQKNAFMGEGVLLLEDIDLWGMPYFDQQPPEDFGGFIVASLSRGAREAVNLIQSAVEHPDVHVLASMSSVGDLDPFFLDILEPFTLVEIELPDDEERSDIWMDIEQAHPSMRAIERDALVRYSQGMPRCDIYMAAQEAIDEAYRESLSGRAYKPVTEANLFEKLAAYHPLESDEYRMLEDMVVSSLRGQIDSLEDYMNGEND